MLLTLTLTLMFACIPDRELLSVPVTAEPGEASFASGDATVQLTEASLTLSDLRLEAPAETARRWTLISSAHAHPGHESAGGVFGELIGEWTLDLLGEEVLLGESDCYEGSYATAHLTLSEATLAGTTTVDGTARAFSLVLSPEQAITGIDFILDLSAEAPPSGLVLSFDLQHALSFVDWRIDDADADGVLTVADGDLGSTAQFGVVSTPTYTLSTED